MSESTETPREPQAAKGVVEQGVGGKRSGTVERSLECAEEFQNAVQAFETTIEGCAANGKQPQRAPSTREIDSHLSAFTLNNSECTGFDAQSEDVPRVNLRSLSVKMPLTC